MRTSYLASVLLTAALLLFGYLVDTLFLSVVTVWLRLALSVWFILFTAFCIRSVVRKEPMIEGARYGLRAIPLVVLGGLATPAYNSVKTYLNRYELWADPMLAKIDLALFDWLYVEALSVGLASQYYFLAWLFALMLTLIPLGLMQASLRVDSLILGYFILWCVFAPVVQALLPSGGPIFYQRLGHGDLFADYPFAHVTQGVADYLWARYQSGLSEFSTGISAMPSMHVASSTWIALAWRDTRAFPIAALFALSIFVLSVALGWHYALDGIVGALMAWGAVRLARWLLQKGPTRFQVARKVPQPSA